MAIATIKRYIRATSARPRSTRHISLVNLNRAQSVNGLGRTMASRNLRSIVQAVR